MCLTIRQNELRLGRQQISSLREEVFGVYLLTSPVDPLLKEKAKNFEVVEGRRERSGSLTRDRHDHTFPFRLRCPCSLLPDGSPRPSSARHAELERTRQRGRRKARVLLRLPPQNFLQRKRHTVRSIPFYGLVCVLMLAFSDGTSSCPPGTVLTGLNYLKGQTQVVALPDEDYPPWLWKLLEPRNLVDDGPGGKAEKVLLRKQNRQRIRDQNLLKTQ